MLSKLSKATVYNDAKAQNRGSNKSSKSAAVAWGHSLSILMDTLFEAESDKSNKGNKSAISPEKNSVLPKMTARSMLTRLDRCWFFFNASRAPKLYM